MKAKIIFCGEVVGDFHEQPQNPGNFSLSLGGSFFFGAVGAVKAVEREGLDCGVSFVAPLSTDMFGERFFNALRDSDVDVSHVKRVDRPTTLAFVSIRPGQENAFSFYSNGTAERMVALEDLPQGMRNEPGSKIFCFGSIASIMEPARFAWLRFAEAQRDNSLVYYDLNTRPPLVDDMDEYRRIVSEWAGVAHVMKASDVDIGNTYPDLSFREVADLWMARGAKIALFTKGKDGSEAYTAQAWAQAGAQLLQAHNTVGAGDNFSAGAAVELVKAGVFTPEAIDHMDVPALVTLLAGANRTAANHLISIGAMSL